MRACNKSEAFTYKFRFRWYVLLASINKMYKLACFVAQRNNKKALIGLTCFSDYKHNKSSSCRK